MPAGEEEWVTTDRADTFGHALCQAGIVWNFSGSTMIESHDGRELWQ